MTMRCSPLPGTHADVGAAQPMFAQRIARQTQVPMAASRRRI
jgi:hypothetical protein